MINDFTPAQIRTKLQNSADKVPGMGGNNHTEKYGYGRLNAHQALIEALCLPVYFEDQIVFSDKTISRCHTVVRNVTVYGGHGWWLPPATLTINSEITRIQDNVTVQDGAKLIINADNVRIDKNFEAELGSELVINPN